MTPGFRKHKTLWIATSPNFGQQRSEHTGRVVTHLPRPIPIQRVAAASQDPSICLREKSSHTQPVKVDRR